MAGNVYSSGPEFAVGFAVFAGKDFDDSQVWTAGGGDDIERGDDNGGVDEHLKEPAGYPAAGEILLSVDGLRDVESVGFTKDLVRRTMKWPSPTGEATRLGEKLPPASRRGVDRNGVPFRAIFTAGEDFGHVGDDRS